MKRSATQLRSRVCFRVGASAALILLSVSSAAANSIQYLIRVDTSSVVSGTLGSLDFQFNPGDLSSQLAFATMSNFNVDGGALVFDPAVPSPQPILGSVVGSLLPGPLAFTNDSAFNDFSQQFNFGNFFSFVLLLTGPALDSPDNVSAGSTFSVSLFDPLGQAPILTNQPSPVVASVNVNSDGTTTVFALDVGGRPLATFQEVPEPGTMLLFGFGASGLFMLRKIRR